MTTRSIEFWAGLRDELPLQAGVVPFGMIYGVLALQAGMPPWAAQLSSAIVFAGSAQLIIAQMLGLGAGLLTIGATAAALNARHLLYSAAIAPYVAHLPRRWRALLAYVLTDEAFAVAITRYQRDEAGGAATPAPLAHWYFLGAGVTLWSFWQGSTALGVFLGGNIPAHWQLDFAVPLTFIALLALLLRERAAQVAAAVSAAVALALAGLPLKLGLLLAIVTGVASGALLRAPRHE